MQLVLFRALTGYHFLQSNCLVPFQTIDTSPQATLQLLSGLDWLVYQARCASTPFLLHLLFDPKDGDDMFLQVIRLSQNYTVLQARVLYSSQSSSRELQANLFDLNIE
jgi:hypothetical protein